MAITQAMCTAFKQSLLDGEMDFSSDTAQTFKIALYTSNATLDATTSAYTTSNEVVGTGYTAGGNTLTVSVNPTTSGTTAFLSFANTTWPSATFTARGALIYTSAAGNAAIAVLDFGSDKSADSGDFEIVFPTADSSSAIIRVA